MQKEAIVKRYIELSVKNKRLPNIYRFANWLSLPIGVVKDVFPNSDAIWAEVWQQIQMRTFAALEQDESYMGYSVYEKLLAYHFTWIQIATEYRAFLQLKLLKLGPIKWESPDMETMKEELLFFLKQLNEEGQRSGEIPLRLLAGNTLNRLAWYQQLYVMHFWVRDKSDNFEQTDAAIEKSTQWVLDILGRNIVDTSIDFGLFFLQHMKLKGH